MRARRLRSIVRTQLPVVSAAVLLALLAAQPSASAPYAEPPGLPELAVSAATEHTFVYENTPDTTGGRHATPLEIVIEDDPYTETVFEALDVDACDLWWVRVARAEFEGDSTTMTVVGDATGASRADGLVILAEYIESAHGWIRVEGPDGAADLFFEPFTRYQDMQRAFEDVEDQTGVVGYVGGHGAAFGLYFTTHRYGSGQFVRITPLDGAVFTMAAYEAWGTDAAPPLVNGSSEGVTIDGIDVTVDRDGLLMAFAMDPSFSGATDFTVEKVAGSGVPQTYTTRVTRGGPDAFRLPGVEAAHFSSVTLNNAVLEGTTKVIDYTLDATTADRARSFMTAANTALADGRVRIEGVEGAVEVVFDCGSTQDQFIAIVNAVEHLTGVHAAPQESDTVFTSAGYGSSQFTRFTRFGGAVFTVHKDEAYGSDATVTAFAGSAGGIYVDGLEVAIRRPDLDMDCTIADLTVNANGASFIIEHVDDGSVILQPTADPLLWNIVGGQRPVVSTGPIVLNVEVTASPSGRKDITTATVEVRRLGDVDGNGYVNLLDKVHVSAWLNGHPLAGDTLRHVDLTGDGFCNAMDAVVINRLLNSLVVP